MVMQESSCNPKAVSKTGAKGLTQIDWRWWGSFLQDLGIAQDEADLFDPETSIEAGAAILAHLIDRYGSIERALEHYSGGAREYSQKIMHRVAWLR
jgi:soluble lytic murein transglycosylase-like protein